MFRTCILVAIGIFIVVNGEAGEIVPGRMDSAWTLERCFHSALKQSETLAIQKELIAEVEGLFRQSLSAALPDVSFVYSEEYRDRGSTSSTASSRVPEARFTFSQPLFSGFKEFAAIAASRAQGRQREREFERARQLLFIDVVDAFYLLLNYDEDTNTLAAIRQALGERLEELKKREEIGRSRASESASTEARLRRLEADQELVTRDAQVARQLLEFLTGEKVDTVVDVETIAPKLSAGEDYTLRSAERPDVQAARLAWEVARKNVVIAQSGF